MEKRSVTKIKGENCAEVLKHQTRQDCDREVHVIVMDGSAQQIQKATHVLKYRFYVLNKVKNRRSVSVHGIPNAFMYPLCEYFMHSSISSCHPRFPHCTTHHPSYQVSILLTLGTPTPLATDFLSPKLCSLSPIRYTSSLIFILQSLIQPSTK